MSIDTQCNQDAAAGPLGLYDKIDQVIIPLYFINIKVEILSRFARVYLTHKYFNPTDKAIDTVFKFPKGYYQAFDGISAVVDGKEVIGLIDEKKKVLNQYEKDKKEGKTVVKTETVSSPNAKTADMLIAEIGNIPPKKEINVTFTFIQQLDNLNANSLQLILPLTLTPRYVPSDTIRELLKDYIYQGTVDEFTIKNIVYNSNIKYIPTNKGLEYQYDIRIQLKSEKAIKSIVTPMQATTTIIQMIDNYNAMVTLDIAKLNIPNEDFVLKYEVHEEELLKPYLLLTKHPKYEDDYAMYYSFNPYYNYMEQTKGKMLSPIIEDFKANFIFVLDCSGSMYGSRIAYAKTALMYFLKSLPNEGYFNIICFGSDIHLLSETFEPINDTTINQAIEIVEDLEANMGGTELFDVLQYVHKVAKEQTCATRVFVLTDGCVFNTNQCLERIAKSVKKSNIQYNCLGIGNGCSESLVRGVAQEGGGLFAFVKNDIELTENVINLLESSMKHYLSDFELKFENETPVIHSNIKDCRSKSKKIDSNVEFYAMLSTNSNNRITCSYSMPGLFKSKLSFALDIDLSKAVTSSVLHKHIISSTLSQSTDKESIVAQSIKYQVLSKETSLYCVLNDSKLTEEQLAEKLKVEILNVPAYDYLFTLFIFLLTGKKISFTNLIPSMTILELKGLIQASEGIPPDQMRLIFGGKQLEDNESLEKWDLKNEDTLHLVLRLRGGGFSFKAKVIVGNEEKMEYQTQDYKKTYEDMREEICDKLNINEDDYEFINNETILTGIVGQLSPLIKGDIILLKKDKNKDKVPIDDQLVRNQKVTGLWELTELNLSLINLTKPGWDNFLKKSQKWQDKVKLTKNKKRELIVLNMRIIHFIRATFQQQGKYKLIIAKTVKSIKKLWKEYNEAIQKEFEEAFKL